MASRLIRLPIAPRACRIMGFPQSVWLHASRKGRNRSCERRRPMDGDSPDSRTAAAYCSLSALVLTIPLSAASLTM
eukprot:28954-Eustigmatos_ZCMA.PRE.1